MKKRNVLAFCVALVLVCNFLGVSQSGAWFVSGGSFSENSYNTAQVVYLPALQKEAAYNEGIPKYGRLLAGTADNSAPENVVYLVPGESMISSGDIPGATPEKYPSVLSLENFSTVPTNVQVRIDVDFDNQLYNEKNEVIGGPDTITANDNFKWKRQGDTDTYEYGVVDVENNFMPLLRVTFANVTNANVTKLPAEHTAEYANNQAETYSWAHTLKNPTNANSYDSWNLTLNNGSSIIIPRLEPNTQQFYNVITNFEVVANVASATNPDLQTKFDAFFSEHYAGHKITINVKYYAKQTAEGADWSLFDNKEMQIAQLAESRNQASF